MTSEGATLKLQVKNLWVKMFSSEGAISKLQPKNLWVKDIQFRRRHSKTAAKNPEIKCHPKTANEKSCLSKVRPIPKLEAKHGTPPITHCPPLVSKGSKSRSQKLRNASKSCAKPKKHLQKAEAKFTKSTQMINVVLLLVFQCPNAQTLSI